jgi:hypothetical protein
MSRKFDETWTQITTPTPPASGAGASPVQRVAGSAGGVGLECPECGCRHFETTHTIPRTGTILRRRACRNCGRRVVTREKVVASVK